MIYYISKNLDNILKKDFTNIFNNIVYQDSIIEILNKIDDQCHTLIIDTNCINSFEILEQLIINIKKEYNIQIIIIYYLHFNYLSLYPYHVYDYIRFNNEQDLISEINNLINYPQTISDMALSFSLKKQYQKIIGFINLEHHSYTSSFLNNIFYNSLDSINLIECYSNNNFLQEYNNTIKGFIFKSALDQHIFKILSTNYQANVLIIDFGKYINTDKTFLQTIYPIIDRLYVIDTNNYLSQNNKVYQTSKKVLLQNKKVLLTTIPNYAHKKKYKQFLTQWFIENDIKKSKLIRLLKLI